MIAAAKSLSCNKPKGLPRNFCDLVDIWDKGRGKKGNDGTKNIANKIELLLFSERQ